MTAKHHRVVKRSIKPASKAPTIKAPATKVTREPDVNRYKYYLLAGVLLLTTIVYWPSMQNGFVAGDDYMIVVNNPDIRSLSNLPNFFTQAYHAMYCPVKMISHAVDYLFSGPNPAGYHFFSLLYHLVNVSLVFLLIFLLLPNAWGACIAALLFALHPVNVEAVGWLTGRGDLLYAGFYLGGLIAYVCYLAGGRRMTHLLVAFALFVLSALSKASAFTFPLALLALDWYYRRKIGSWRVLLEKAPFFAGAFALGVSAILLRSGHSTPLSDYLTHFSGVNSFVIFLYPLTFYLAKFFVPVNLALPYPHPFASNLPLSWDFYVYPFLLLAIGLLIWRNKSIRRPLAFAFMLYLATLVSAMRLTPMLGTIAADRYFYVAMVPVVFFVAWAFGYLSARRSLWRRRAFPLFCVAVSAFAVMSTAMTHTRIKVFKDAISLFSDAHRKYPQHATPLYELSGGYVYSGDMENAFRTADKILQLLPDNEDALAFQTNLYLLVQRHDDALNSLNRLLRVKPRDNYYMIKASIHQTLQQLDSVLAIVDIPALRMSMNSETRLMAGQLKAEVYVDLKRYDEVIALVDSLQAVFPSAYSLLMPRALAYFNTGAIDTAFSDMQTLIEHDPTNVLAMMNMGWLYSNVGRHDEACWYWQQAALLNDPNALELIKQCP
ncbi:MAG: tetratricopeptide repeat protein [Prevotellaceae bacterium]|jgi:tetratricopeptide (TPR) repeat protein|nr:tetratricopeptide repeat protein [Prevotellaceae bacterium]